MHENIEYNVLQQETIKHVSKDCNLIVQAPTSSGKTIVAEQYIIPTLEKGLKAIYLSPLKALTKEKYDQWKELPFSSRMVTGDYSSIGEFSEQLILMTNESLDSKARSGKNWLKRVGVIVCDESHLIGKMGRGDAFEMGLMQLMAINPACRIIFLSATFPNTKVVADWLTFLNGKPTEVVTTTWRPVKQTLTLIRCDNRYFSAQVETENLIKKWIGVKNKQILVFVHSIKTGETLAKKFGCPFHNSKVPKEERERLEDQYRKKEIKLLVATSTLAYGINLPADIGIICGGTRGMELIEPYDLTQMAGRIGRYGLSEDGKVFLVFHQSYADELYRQVIQTPSITSVLPQRLYFHIINLVWRKKFQRAELNDFFSRSLAARQSRLNSIHVDEAIEKLKRFNILTENSSGLTPTRIGVAAAQFYLDPIDLFYMLKSFLTKPLGNEEIAAAIARIPSNEQECSLPPAMKLEVPMPFSKQTLIATSLNQWLSGVELDPFAVLVHGTVVNDFERWVSGLQVAGLPSEYCNRLSLAVYTGVPLALSSLVKFDGIGRKTAVKLYALGITDEESFLREEIAVRKNLGASIFNKTKATIDAQKAGKIILKF